jgi:hypothetical protein
MISFFTFFIFCFRSPSTSSSSYVGNTNVALESRSSATSWLSKTFKRAFAVNNDLSTLKTSGGDRSSNDTSTTTSRKLVIPQVQITEETIGSKNFWSNGLQQTSTTPLSKVSDKIERVKEKKKKKAIK